MGTAQGHIGDTPGTHWGHFGDTLGTPPGAEPAGAARGRQGHSPGWGGQHKRDPKNRPGHPKSHPGHPINYPGYPKNTWDIPKNTRDIPKSYAGHPKNHPGHPKNHPGYPKTTRDIPKITQDTPKTGPSLCPRAQCDPAGTTWIPTKTQPWVRSHSQGNIPAGILIPGTGMGQDRGPGGSKNFPKKHPPMSGGGVLCPLTLTLFFPLIPHKIPTTPSHSPAFPSPIFHGIPHFSPIFPFLPPWHWAA